MNDKKPKPTSTGFIGYFTTLPPVKPLDLESDEPLAPPECPLRKPGDDEPCEACQ